VQKPIQSLVGFSTILAGLVAWLFSRRVTKEIPGR
jgi:hypothetical protein